MALRKAFEIDNHNYGFSHITFAAAIKHSSVSPCDHIYIYDISVLTGCTIGKRTRNAPKLHLSSRLHWAIRLLFVTNWTWRYIVHPSLLCMPFLFGWPPCQRSDMTLVEVSQHAYDYLYIRTIVLFVFLRNSCKPDIVLVYIFVE